MKQLKRSQNKNKVLLAMSGGVDSSVTAYLLKKAGYDVVGVTMCFGLADREGSRPSCCSISGINDARRVAERFGMLHYSLSFSMPLKQYVVEDFLKEYQRGRTPNPCIRCNQYLKFDLLWQKAKAMGCNYLATGHHARIVFDKRKKTYLLKKGKDKNKDQSYFLYRIPKEILPFVLFPVGDMTKKEVRRIAKKAKIKVADKPGSQDICFIPRGDYRHFLVDKLGDKILKPGPIKNYNREIVGRHKGIVCYTIGQRHGLGVAHSEPLYVIKIDVKKNEIIVGEKKDILGKKLIADESHFLTKRIPKSLAVGAVIRYNRPQAKSRVKLISNNKVKVEFKEPQPAITPGQSVVFYNKDVVLGGAIIERVE